MEPANKKEAARWRNVLRTCRIYFSILFASKRFLSTIFLINGVKLTGVVTSFDNFCVLLRRDGHSQLVYKHAISTIMPGQPMQMFESEEAAS